MRAQLVANALLMAVWRRGKPNALLNHSDQGSQYTNSQFQRLMVDSASFEYGPIRQRLGQRGDGGFFSSLQIERTACNIYRTRNGARADVFDYIERF